MGNEASNNGIDGASPAVSSDVILPDSTGDSIFDFILVIVNIIAIIAGPIIAVLITRNLQTRSSKRDDKKTIFRTLMTYRGWNWMNVECVNSLNIIEVVFYDNQNVLAKWKDLFAKYCHGISENSDCQNIITAQCELLEEMAKDLGYSEYIDWDTIQQSYVPNWLRQNLDRQQQFAEMQLSIGNAFLNSPFASSGQSNTSDID